MKFTSNNIWIFEDDDINTDLIFPGKYTYKLLEDEEMAQYAMEDYKSEFSEEVEEGDILIVGNNFGCGSSREQAVTCLKAAGVSVIIAKSFARIYYRNAINKALPVVSCPDAVEYTFNNKEKIKNSTVMVDMETGLLKIGDKEFNFPKMAKQALKIFEAGGLANYTKMRLKNLES